MVMLWQNEDERKHQTNNSIHIYTDQHEHRQNPGTNLLTTNIIIELLYHEII